MTRTQLAALFSDIPDYACLVLVYADFKPDKVHTLFPEEVPQKLWPLPVRELFMLGPATGSVGSTASASTRSASWRRQTPELVLHYLNKPGLALWHSANGRCSEELLPQPEANKGYGNSNNASRRCQDGGGCAARTAVALRDGHHAPAA